MGPDDRGPVGAPEVCGVEPTEPAVDDVLSERPRIRRQQVLGAEHGRRELARVVAPDVVLEQFGVPAAGGGCARDTGMGAERVGAGAPGTGGGVVMFGRSVLGWLAVIAVDVVVILAGLWLLRGLIAQAPVLGTLLFVGVVLAALALSIVVVQALTRRAGERP
jgi:hypothetical protein